MIARRVFVTGLGAVSAFGRGVHAFWNGCLSGESIVAATPAAWRQYYRATSQVWSPLPVFDYKSFGFTRADVLTNSTAVLMAMTAADEALEHANAPAVATLAIDPAGATPLSRYRAAVFIGTGLGGAQAPFENYRAHLLAGLKPRLDALREELPDDEYLREHTTALQAHPRVNPLVICQTMPNSISASLGIRYKFHGPNDTTCHACASGTVAIGHAYKAIRNGEIDFAIAGGVEHLNDRAGGAFMGFDRLQTLAKPRGDLGTENRPFDKSRSGFLFSEGGAAILILESESFANNRGAIPLAEVVGFGHTSDGYSVAAISEMDNSIRAMLDQTIADAAIDRHQIGYVNGHGTSTELNDPIEARLLDQYFKHAPKVNSTKSILGHTIGASGAFEAIVCTKSLQSQRVHISRNLDEPIVDLNFCTASEPYQFEYALSQSFGFGGHNAGLIFRKID